MQESCQVLLIDLEAQKSRLISAYTKGVLSLDELAIQKTALDKQISDLGQAVAALSAETNTSLLSAEGIEDIEAIAAGMRSGAVIADNDKEAQRAIFQLLEVHVILDHEKKERWADVTCSLGQARCTVNYDMTYHNRV